MVALVLKITVSEYFSALVSEKRVSTFYKLQKTLH